MVVVAVAITVAGCVVTLTWVVVGAVPAVVVRSVIVSFTVACCAPIGAVFVIRIACCSLLETVFECFWIVFLDPASRSDDLYLHRFDYTDEVCRFVPALLLTLLARLL